MPYHVGTHTECPMGQPHAVLKDADGKLMGCHATEGEAQDQIKALYANEAASGRQFRAFDLRDVRVERRSGAPVMVGHAAVFGSLSEDFGGWNEEIARGAFKDTLNDRGIYALWNHDERFIIAGTNDGSLRLSEDEIGLRAEMDPIDTPTINDLVLEPMRRGLVNKMSFAFDVLDDGWTKRDGRDIRTVRKVKLYDVSPVTFPAYPATDISARSLQAILRAAPRAALAAALRDMGDEMPMDQSSCEEAGGTWDDNLKMCDMRSAASSRAQASATDGKRTSTDAGASAEIYRLRVRRHARTQTVAS